MKRFILTLTLCLFALPAFAVPASDSGPVINSSTTIGTSSVTVLAAGQRKFLYVANVSASATVTCSFVSTTVTANAAGDLPTLAAGASLTFSGTFIPNNALACVSSAASTPLTVLSY